MGMLGNALKIAVIAKVVQVVQREASKPENRRRASEALASYKNRGRPSAQ